jgi:Superinfection immunity protein
LIFTLAPAKAQSPQYRRPAPAPEECPQGRQIRAQKSYPTAMTDCEVLDADTTTENQKLQRPQASPATRQLPKAPLALVAAPAQSRAMNYPEVAMSSCTALLSAFGTPAFGDMGLAIIDFVNTRTDQLGSGANVEDFVATECRLHEDITVGQAIENLFEQQKQNRLPRIPIGGATDSPAVHASWNAFNKWVHHQGLRPDFQLVDTSERAESTNGFTDNLKNPFGQNKMSSGLAWTILLGALIIYFMPALIAANRGHHNALAISALNLFLGWSFLGWVIAFVWACTQTQKRDPIEHGDVMVTRREPRL